MLYKNKLIILLLELLLFSCLNMGSYSHNPQYPQFYSLGETVENTTPYKNVECKSFTPYKNVECTPYKFVECTPYKNVGLFYNHLIL